MFFLPIHVRRIFWTYVQLPVMTGSTSCFLRTLKLVTSTCFPSNPSTLNSMKIFSTSGYGFRSLLVCRKHYENVTSTLFLNKTSTLNTMKIFSASGYDEKYFWFLKNLQKLYFICLIISYIMKGASQQL